MGLFSRDEHHETPCQGRDGGGPSWIRKDHRGKPNPMGWGSSEPRTVKRAGKSARDEGDPLTMHGSQPERNLMKGMGGLVKWSGVHVRVTGEGPGSQRRRGK